jgi:lipoprotein-releasing system permease protein
MLRPLPLGLGLRYVRARRRSFFVSFITWVSLLGVCLGVAALITVLSVMNGFEGELRDRLVSLSAHATVTDRESRPREWATVAAALRTQPHVVAAAPFVEVQGLLSGGPQLSAATLRGVDPAEESLVAAIGPAMVAGRLDALTAGAHRIVLGRVLAFKLEVGVGDRVTMLLPQTDESGALAPQIATFEVSGIFEVGLQDHDSVLALVSLDDLRALAGNRAPAGVRLRFDDVMAAPLLAREAGAALGEGITTRDWTEEHAAYFHAIRLEKTMMTLILLLIVAVAAFNIVASLVMVVTEKRTDIAILRTLGMAPAGVAATFVTQGTVIGWLGTLSGVVLGLTLATHVSDIVPVLERAFGFQIFDADVYYITRIPSEVHVPDVTLVALAALVLTTLATLYPALRAARTAPAEALRYE